MVDGSGVADGSRFGPEWLMSLRTCILAEGWKLWLRRQSLRTAPAGVSTMFVDFASQGWVQLCDSAG